MDGGLTALSVIGFIIGIAAERLRSGSSTGLGLGAGARAEEGEGKEGEAEGKGKGKGRGMPARRCGDMSAECAAIRRATGERRKERTDETWLRLLGPLLPPVRLYLWLEKNWPKTPPPPPGVIGPIPRPLVPCDWV